MPLAPSGFSLARLVATLGTALFVAGCATTRADERMAYWRAETDRALPVGSSHARADDFFRTRGLELRCCATGPGFENAWVAYDRNVASGFVMTYDVWIVIEFEADTVARTRVIRLGLGP